MNNQSLEYIDEISRKNISIIIIHGCTDPTYSSSVFVSSLIIDKQLEFDRYGQFQKTNLSVSDWIRTTIENEVHPDYEIFKHKNVYIITEDLGLEKPYESEENGQIHVSYGGFISFYPTNN